MLDFRCCGPDSDINVLGFRLSVTRPVSVTAFPPTLKLLCLRSTSAGRRWTGISGR